MGSVVPLKKSANSAFLELKNLLSEKLNKVETLIQHKLKSDVKINRERMNIIIVKKYLLISSKLKLIFVKTNLFIKIFLGLLKDKI